MLVFLFGIGITLFVTTCSIDLKERPQGECLITQQGKDGLGHQYEGKLSCVVLGKLSTKFVIFHTPFSAFEHAKLSAEQVETFTNIRYGILTHAELKDNSKFHNKFIGGSPELNKWVKIFESKSCDYHTIYALDNCWDFLYKPPIVDRVDEILNSSTLRDNYLLTPKPMTGFDLNRTNVVIHIRRGDAGGRMGGFDYFVEGMMYYNATLDPAPLFWIETDESDWKGLLGFEKIFPGNIRFPSTASTDGQSVLTTFHRFVMADGLVASYSSFSFAAAYLSRAKKIVIEDNDFDGVRTQWLRRSSRFHRILPQQNYSQIFHVDL